MCILYIEVRGHFQEVILSFYHVRCGVSLRSSGLKTGPFTLLSHSDTHTPSPSLHHLSLRAQDLKCRKIQLLFL